MPLTQQADIQDYNTYNEKMDRSIMDKLFFVDKVNDPDLIVDFGCATGSLLNHLSKWFPDTKLIGYDKDKEMIDRLWDKHGNDQTDGTWKWEQIERVVDETDGPSVLVLSSVIHEVYHYSDVDQIDTFWDRVWNSGFDYIVIRDMIPSKTIDRRPSMNDVRKVYSNFGGTKELEDFVNEWGSIETSHKQLVHFLLKYRYTQPNWSREVRENYFPFYVEDLMMDIPDRYSILFNHHFALPYLKQQIRKDFGIELEDPTHFKLILELN